MLGLTYSLLWKPSYWEKSLSAARRQTSTSARTRLPENWIRSHIQMSGNATKSSTKVGQCEQSQLIKGQYCLFVPMRRSSFADQDSAARKISLELSWHQTCSQKEMAATEEGGHFNSALLRLLTFLLSTHASQHTATFHSASLPRYRSSVHEYPLAFPTHRYL
jgi:hypothetical protein